MCSLQKWIIPFSLQVLKTMEIIVRLNDTYSLEDIEKSEWLMLTLLHFCFLWSSQILYYGYLIKVQHTRTNTFLWHRPTSCFSNPRKSPLVFQSDLQWFMHRGKDERKSDDRYLIWLSQNCYFSIAVMCNMHWRVGACTNALLHDLHKVV